MVKKRRRGSGDPSRHGRVAPFARRRQDRQVLAQFATWYDDAGGGDVSGAEMAEILQRMWSLLADQGVTVLLTEPTADLIDDLLTDLEDADPEAADFVVHVVHEYLHFLGETGTWSGATDDLNESLQLVHEWIEPEDFGLRAMMGEVISDEIDGEVRDTAVRAAAIVAAVPDLLTWLGRSRQITASGWLRLADIEPFAALLGLRVVGRRSRSDDARPMQDEALFDLEVDDDDRSHDEEVPVEVMAMQDHPALYAWWSALLETGLLMTTKTTVRPGPRVEDWRSEDVAVNLAVREELVSRYVLAVVEHQQAGRFGPQFFADMVVADLTLHLLVAMRPDVEPELSALEVMASGMDDAAIAPGLAGLTGLAHARTPAIMRQLAGAGVIEIRRVDGGARYAVPEGLRPALARAITMVIDAAM